jgi:hypothetical protein
LACRNICERIYSKKIVFGKNNYSIGKKFVKGVKFTCTIKVHFAHVVICS